MYPLQSDNMTGALADIDVDSLSAAPLAATGTFCAELMSVLNAVESAFRQLHPPLLPQIAEALKPFRDRLEAADQSFPADERPAALKAALVRAFEQIRTALDRLIAAGEGDRNDGTPGKIIGGIMEAIRAHSRAQESIYPLHYSVAPVSRYFLEPGLREQWESFGVKGDPDRTGLHTLSDPDGRRRDHYLYVPESWDGTSEIPLVAALHGGSQTGRDFVWHWLREARSRRLILLAPKSGGRTWSFDSADDANAIFGMVDALKARYSVNSNKILLTGFSDGAIYTLTCGHMADSPFTALAPISGVLHPVHLENAGNKRIYMVHGRLDWMFPIAYARQAFQILKTAGADVSFRELPDLSHTYPRKENANILEWFDPDLSLDRPAST